MVATLTETTMAKKKGRPKQVHGEGTQARLDTDLVTMARYIVAREGGSMVRYLSDILRPTIERDFAKAQPNVKPGGGEN